MKPVIDIDPSDKWFGLQAVYRISMGQFVSDPPPARLLVAMLHQQLTVPAATPQLFFSVLSLALVGVKYKGDKRDRYLHHGHWLLKLALWLVFTALPFFFPNNVVMAYGKRPSLPVPRPANSIYAATPGVAQHIQQPTPACHPVTLSMLQFCS